MTKPIDFADMLAHIAAARGCPEPVEAQITEMRRALGNLNPDAVRSAVADWLRTDTTAIKRLPYPGEILPGAQAHARVLAMAAQHTDRDPLYECPHCLDAKWIDHGDAGVTPCARCLPATYSRWQRGHYRPKHNADACVECQAVRSGKAVASAVASQIDDTA